MSVSTEVVETLRRRQEECRAKRCDIQKCDAALFRQCAAAVASMSVEERRDATMDDLRYRLTTTVLKSGGVKPRHNPYDMPMPHAPKIKLLIGNVPVCLECCGAFYSLPKATIRLCIDRACRGEEHYIHHTACDTAGGEIPVRMQKRFKAVDAFLEQIKQSETSAVLSSEPPYEATARELPFYYTKIALYNRYAAAVGHESKVPYEDFVERWKSHHGDLLIKSKQKTQEDGG